MEWFVKLFLLTVEVRLDDIKNSWQSLQIRSAEEFQIYLDSKKNFIECNLQKVKTIYSEDVLRLILNT